jgi:hypothetical protein
VLVTPCANRQQSSFARLGAVDQVPSTTTGSTSTPMNLDKEESAFASAVGTLTSRANS